MSTNRPLQVRDILLAPGQYVFRLTKPDVDHSVVSIYNSQTNRLERTIIGLPAYRLTADDKHGFTVSQLQAGRRAKLQTWFYPGENFGWSFGPGEERRTAPQSNPTGNLPDTGPAGDGSATR